VKNLLKIIVSVNFVAALFVAVSTNAQETYYENLGASADEILEKCEADAKRQKLRGNALETFIDECVYLNSDSDEDYSVEEVTE